jgi:hypothetical protein
VTSVVELKAHRMAIGACFVFRREISRFVFWDFFDSIDPERTLNPELASLLFAGSLHYDIEPRPDSIACDLFHHARVVPLMNEARVGCEKF